MDFPSDRYDKRFIPEAGGTLREALPLQDTKHTRIKKENGVWPGGRGGGGLVMSPGFLKSNEKSV